MGFIFLCLLIAALACKPYFLKPSNLNACMLDADCIIIPPIGCGYPSSINKSNLGMWNLCRSLGKFPPIIAACSPSPPVDAFQPFCLHNACRTVLIHDHAILEFSQLPALDRPIDLIFRTSADMQIVLPPGGFEVIDITYPAGGEHGQFAMPLQLWWRGPVRADESLEIRATVKVTKPGWGLAYGELRSAELPENVI